MLATLNQMFSFSQIWQAFFFGAGAVPSDQTLADDYWNSFIESGIGEAIRFGLFQWMCDECLRSNPYVLYSIVGVCDQIILSIE